MGAGRLGAGAGRGRSGPGRSGAGIGRGGVGRSAPLRGDMLSAVTLPRTAAKVAAGYGRIKDPKSSEANRARVTFIKTHSLLQAEKTNGSSDFPSPKSDFVKNRLLGSRSFSGSGRLGRTRLRGRGHHHAGAVVHRYHIVRRHRHHIVRGHRCRAVRSESGGGRSGASLGTVRTESAAMLTVVRPGSIALKDLLHLSLIHI